MYKEKIEKHLLWLDNKHKGCEVPKTFLGAKADFTAEDLRELDFSGFDLTSALFPHANLLKTNFRGANLSNAYMRHCNLEDADLRDCNLTGIFLEHSNLKNTKLEGCYVLKDGKAITIDWTHLKGYGKLLKIYGVKGMAETLSASPVVEVTGKVKKKKREVGDA